MKKLIKDYLKKNRKFSAHGELYQGIPGQENGTRNLEDRWRMYNITPNDLREKTVVDIGCNVGGFSVFCQSYCKDYLGIDTDAESIKLARELFDYGNCKFEVGKFRELYGTFDIILALAVRRYTGLSFEEFARDCHKLLNKNGIMYFESHGREKYTPQAEKAFLKYFKVESLRLVPSISHADCENFRFFVKLVKK